MAGVGLAAVRRRLRALVLLDLIGRLLYQIFEEPLMVLTLVADAPIFFGFALGSTGGSTVRITRVLELDVRLQLSLLRGVLVRHGRRARVERLLHRLGRLPTVIYCRLIIFI